MINRHLPNGGIAPSTLVISQFQNSASLTADKLRKAEKIRREIDALRRELAGVMNGSGKQAGIPRKPNGQY